MRGRNLAILAALYTVILLGIVAIPRVEEKRNRSATAARQTLALLPGEAPRNDAEAIGVRGGTLRQDYASDGVRLSGPWGGVQLSLLDVRLGDRKVDLGPAVAAERAGEEVLYRRGAVLEKYVVGNDAVEQIFVLDRSLEGCRGDLSIRVGLATSLEIGPYGDRMEFRDSSGATVLTYGSATAIDADGRTERLAYSVENRTLSMVLDREFLASARFPLVVDPIIGTNIQVQATSAPEHLPDMAYSPDVDAYVIAYETGTSSTGAIACRVVSGSGNLAGEAMTVSTATVDSRKPSIAWGTAGQFLIAWQQYDLWTGWSIVAQRIKVDANGALTLDGTVTTIASDSSLKQVAPDVGFSTTADKYLVVWEKFDAYSMSWFGPTRWIQARAVSNAGSAGSSFSINSFTSYVGGKPTVVPRCAGAFGVAWARGGDIYASSVDASSMTATTPAAVTTNPYVEGDPQLGGTPDATFLVWSSFSSYASSAGPSVSARKIAFTTSGFSLGNAFEVVSDTAGASALPRCDAATFETLDRLLVTYRVASSGNWNIVAKVYNFDGDPPAFVESLSLSESTGEGAAGLAVRASNLTALVAFDRLGANADLYVQRVALDHIVGTPSTPSGPSSGVVNTSYTYASGGSKCNQGHAVQYRFRVTIDTAGTWSDWETSLPASFQWSQEGTYYVQASSTCTQNIEISSAVSGTFAVQVTSSIVAPAIAEPSPLPTLIAGVDANPMTFAATGTAPMTWTVTGGSLPLGMSLASATGTYSGTPATAGDYTFTVTATNNKGFSNKVFTQTVQASPPGLQVSPTSLTFTLQAGQGSSSQTLSISNGGGGTLTWSLAIDYQTNPWNLSVPWLSATPMTGKAPKNVEITAVPFGALSGSYHATITISVPGTQIAPVTVSVTMNIQIQAVAPYNVKPATLPDGVVGQVFSKSLTASGTIPITWSLGAGAPLGMTLDSNGLYHGTPKEAGEYHFKVWAKNVGGETGVDCVQIVNPAAVPGSVDVSPTDGLASSWDGSAFTPTSKTFTLKNPGTQASSWSAQAPASWLFLSASGGSLTGGQSSDLVVSINPSVATELAPGNYTATVAITSNGKSESRNVWLTIGTAGPMKVESAEDFVVVRARQDALSSTSTKYTVTNTGTALLKWTASFSDVPAPSWISLSTSGGDLKPGESAELTVSLDPPIALALSGTPTATLALKNASNGKGDTTRQVFLFLDGTPGLLSVSPADSFISVGRAGGPFAPAHAIYVVSNIGGNPIHWIARCNREWITLDPADGLLADGASVSVTVSLHALAESLVAGNHEATVEFVNLTGNQGNSSRAVRLAIGGLAVSPGAVFSPSGTVGGPFAPLALEYTLTNLGDSSIDWGAAAGQGWTLLSAKSGVNLAPGSEVKLTVSVDPAIASAFSAGNYSDVVQFKNLSDAIGSTTRTIRVNATKVPTPPPAGGDGGGTGGGGGGGGGCGSVGIDLLLPLALFWLRRRRSGFSHAGRSRFGGIIP